MLSGKFIFSDQPRDRISRHVAFWLGWWFYFGMLHAANPFGKPEISYFRNVPYTMLESFLLILPQIPIAYAILYFILPRYILPGKYLKAFILIAIIMTMAAFLTLFMMDNVNTKILAFLLPKKFMPNAVRPADMHIFMALLGTFKGALTASAVATGIKLIKEWYKKEQRNIQLLKENAEAQLLLLTAQVHPHFLFNTLNNIYSQTQTESPKGSKMIMELSDMLRYILSEGNKSLVPLANELAMIRGYIHLEKIRYGNKLEVHVAMPDDEREYCIAPLLLLPFVENCFKHGTSNILRNPWINLNIEMRGEVLIMKLMNGKAPVIKSDQPRSGIGINNVVKRLELLYKKKYELLITDDAEVFIVDLKVELVKEENNGATINKTANQLVHA